MKLKELLKAMQDGTEITVVDNEWDVDECYFYNDFRDSKWDKPMEKLSNGLEIVEMLEHKVAVNFSEIIEKNIEEINKAELFETPKSLEYIMVNLNLILSGMVSEEWFEEFVNIITK